MNKVPSEKVCVVCGDRSLGFNFNVISCESCKAFFRRNALSNKKFTCPFSNACEITIITRRFCQKCRLDKCFKVGMKKEYIMTDEDKELKKKKIEQNRNKRKSKLQSREVGEEESCEEAVEVKKKIKEECSPTSTTADFNDSDDQVLSLDRLKISSDSSVYDIVHAITEVPNEASQIIQQVMKTQSETLSVMSRIIQESNQALLLISHLIKFPSDGMLIISKMMAQSPLDALSVFSKFLNSPTDALHIIFKVMSSPNDVLKFMTELTNFPENALDIMNRFIPAPRETIQGVNRLINPTSSKTTAESAENETIKSMLDVSSIDSPNSIASPSSSIHSAQMADSDSNNNNNNNDNDYQHMTATILREIACDLSGKQTPFKENSIEQIINEAIKLEYTTPQIAQMQNASRELNEIEIMKIQELLDANHALYLPIEDDHLSFLDFAGSPIKSEASQFIDPILLKVINLTAVAIRRLIKMSKKISGFKKMCQEDQVALLKGGCTEMMILRSVMQYDCDRAFWKIPSTNTTNLRADILKLCPKGNVYEEHENFIKTFDLKLRTDERIILILCAITLFSPDRASTVHRDVIKLEQNSYYFLLRRYLESVYDGCESRSIFLQLLRKIYEVRRLNEDVISVYLDVNPGEVEPLLREIFDLKT